MRIKINPFVSMGIAIIAVVIVAYGPGFLHFSAKGFQKLSPLDDVALKEAKKRAKGIQEIKKLYSEASSIEGVEKVVESAKKTFKGRVDD